MNPRRICAISHARFGQATRPARHRRRRRRPWAIESLEGRTLLSTFTVNSLGDTGTGSGTSGDLRYVITQVDQAGGDNTIDFTVTGTITLNSALPDLSDTTGQVDIDGPGASRLTVARSAASGTPDFRILTIDANTKVKIVGLTIADGIAPEGGGLLIDGGTVASNVAVINNQAVGAEGAAASTARSGPGRPGAPAAAQGGGIYLSGGGLTLKNDVISGNVARGCRRRQRRSRHSRTLKRGRAPVPPADRRPAAASMRPTEPSSCPATRSSRIKPSRASGETVATARRDYAYFAISEGAGGPGGAGNSAAGGAIYLAQGTLTLTRTDSLVECGRRGRRRERRGRRIWRASRILRVAGWPWRRRRTGRQCWGWFRGWNLFWQRDGRPVRSLTSA